MSKRNAAKASLSFADLRALTPDQWQAALAGDPAIAAQWLIAAAQYGFVEAQTVLGQNYLDGRGVPKDATVAITWFSAAAQGRYAPALNMLGRCYERGWGCLADFPRAADCYRQAAEAGLDWGQYNLANMVLRGRGTQRDRRQAFGWYSRAAAQGHAKSMNMIGRFLEEGWDRPRDRVAAATWYRRAAEGEDFRGQYNLASLLALDGDVEAAVYWLDRSMDLASPDFLALMAKRLASSDQEALRAAGQRAAHKYARLGTAQDDPL
jgi:TPR repeat protein